MLVIILLSITASILFNFYSNLLSGRWCFPHLSQRILFAEGSTKDSRVLVGSPSMNQLIHREELMVKIAGFLLKPD